jgi:hypothetical protein
MGYRQNLTAILVVIGIGVGGLTGCGQAAAESGDKAVLRGEASKVEAIPGSAVKKVSLSPQASQRLGVALGAVSIQPVNGVRSLVVPYSAVIYDAAGGAFVYTTAEPNVFVRAPVTVTDVADDLAAVSTAPPVGTPVVTVGASELLGAETGVGDE